VLKGLGGATIWSEDLNNLLQFYRDLPALPIAHEAVRVRGLGQKSRRTPYCRRSRVHRAAD
jgi:hypothetical protein